MFQCYFLDENGKRCSNQQEDYWCSDAHKTNWQAKNYKIRSKQSKGRRLTIDEMKQRLIAMGRGVKLEKKTDPNGQLRI